MPRITAPEGHRPARIKIKLGKRPPSIPDPAPTPESVPSGRPKRKSARPVRYSEEVLKLGSPRKKSTPLREMPTTEPEREPSSKLTSPPPPVKATSVRGDVDEDKPRGYSANFLANFIEDASPENEDTPMEDVTPSAEPEVEPESTEPTSLPPAIPISSDIEITGCESLTKREQKNEDPETVIKKLQVACHSLSNLNIPPPVLRIDPPSPARTVEPTTKEQVNNLFTAAMDDGPEAPKQPDSPYAGSVDEDLDLMVRHAMQILRQCVVEKNQLAGRLRTATRQSTGRPGRSKKPAAAAHSADNEKFAMSALGELIDSRALNINCKISRDRAHLLRCFYQQLLALIMEPSRVLPRQYQFVPPAMPFAADAAMAAQQQLHLNAHPPMGAPPPAPHQFLLRDQQPHHNPDLVQYQAPIQYTVAMSYPPVPYNVSTMNGVPPFQPGLVLPRSGQAMMVSFGGAPLVPGTSAVPKQQQMHPPPPPSVPVPNGSHPPHQFLNAHLGRGQNAPVFIAPNPPPPQAPKRRTSAQGSTKGYPFPGAVVLDE